MYSHPGVALSGIFTPNPWVPDPTTAITEIAALGFKRISLPFWLMPGITYAMKPVADHAHSLGLTVHYTPHLDGPASVRKSLPITDPEQYYSEVREHLSGAGVQKGDSVEWANELIIDDWSALPPFYTGVGAQLQDLIRSYGAESVAPLPMDQAPQRVMDFLQGMMNPQVANPDSWSAHLYGTDLDPQLPTAISQLNIIHAASLILNKPVRITEFGALLATGPGMMAQHPPSAPTLTAAARPVPNPIFYSAVASYCDSAGTWGTSWQWQNPGDGYGINGYPAVQAGLLGTTPP